MSTHVAILLADGFEEAEAIITIDILERLGIKVKKIACADSLYVKSYHNINIECEALLNDCSQIFDLIVIPGGPEGTSFLSENEQVISFVKKHIEQNKWISAICSAGAKVLAKNNLLSGSKYVCSGELNKQFSDGFFVDENVVVSNNFITGKGLGVSFEFAFKIAEILGVEQEKIVQQIEHIYCKF